MEKKMESTRLLRAFKGLHKGDLGLGLKVRGI